MLENATNAILDAFPFIERLTTNDLKFGIILALALIPTGLLLYLVFKPSRWDK